jgi:hypothetical protein
LVARTECSRKHRKEECSKMEVVRETADYAFIRSFLLELRDAALVEVERNFNLDAAIDRLAARTDRWPHLPVLHLCQRFFF